MKITVSLKNAGKVIADLVKEGLTFEAHESDNGFEMVIELTGGF